MANKVIALIMALLIGNPVCCCFAADFFRDTDKSSSPEAHCCCTASKDGENERNDQDRESCPCLLKKKFAVGLSLISPKLSGNDCDSLSLPVTTASLELPCVALAVVHISKWPPGSLPIPSLNERLARQCSYLL